MGLSDAEVRRVIRKLAIAYGKPPDAEEEVVALWRSVLDSVSLEAVEEAVKRYVQSSARFFPRAGVIREMAREIDGQRNPEPAAVDSTEDQAAKPCPVCGAVLEYAANPEDDGHVYDPREGKRRPRREGDPAPVRRYRVIHDGWVHKKRGVPAVGDVSWNRAAS
jgi:hypothetical protein